MPEEQRWDIDMIEAIKGTPWRPVPFRYGHGILTHIAEQREDDMSEDEGQNSQVIDSEEEAEAGKNKKPASPRTEHPA